MAINSLTSLKLKLSIIAVICSAKAGVNVSTKIKGRECASLVVAVDCGLCFRFCFSFFSGLPLSGVALVISSSSLGFSPSITILQLIKLFIQKIANKNFCRNKNVRINVHKPQNYVCKLISIISYALFHGMCIKTDIVTFSTPTQTCTKLFFKIYF